MSKGEEGFEFRFIKLMNIALLEKQSKRIGKDSDSLWKEVIMPNVVSRNGRVGTCKL